MPGRKKIVILGGSFDPPTIAHKKMAINLSKKFDEVLVCPSFKHRGKGDQSKSFLHRLNMCVLAFRGLSRVSVNPVEGTVNGNGSTYDLVSNLAESYRMSGLGVSLALAVGSDCLHDFKNWYKSEQLLGLLEGLVCFRRDGLEPPKELMHKVIYGVDFDMGVSSTEVRASLAKVGYLSLVEQSQMPSGVYEYAVNSGMYLDKESYNARRL